VFNASLVVDSKVVISAVGVDNDGSRLFLGREDGMLEEFSIDAGSADGVTASLTARKPLALRVSTLSAITHYMYHAFGKGISCPFRRALSHAHMVSGIAAFPCISTATHHRSPPSYAIALPGCIIRRRFCSFCPF